MKDEDLTGLFGRLLGAEEKLLASELRVRLAAMNVKAQALGASDLVPQYNYWPVASAASGPGANALTQFTDGGDLENTGWWACSPRPMSRRSSLSSLPASRSRRVGPRS